MDLLATVVLFLWNFKQKKNKGNIKILRRETTLLFIWKLAATGFSLPKDILNRLFDVVCKRLANQNRRV